MAIVTRAGKGSALTHTEMDANLNEISLKAPVNSPAFTGRTLVGTSTDNGVDRLQVNGSIGSSTVNVPLNVYVKSQTTAGSELIFELPTGNYAGLILCHIYSNNNANGNKSLLLFVNTREYDYGGGNGVNTVSNAVGGDTGENSEITVATVRLLQFGASGHSHGLGITVNNRGGTTCSVKIQLLAKL
jgi:hypothetical protein